MLKMFVSPISLLVGNSKVMVAAQWRKTLLCTTMGESAEVQDSSHWTAYLPGFALLLTPTLKEF